MPNLLYLDDAGVATLKTLIGEPTDEQVTAAVNAVLAAHPEWTTTVQDGSITGPKIADNTIPDAKLAQTGGVLSAMQSLVGTSADAITNLSSYTQHQGMIASTGKWANINDRYKHIVIPIEDTGANLTLTANGNIQLFFAGLRTYSEPVNGADVDFSTATGWTERISVASNLSYTGAIPDDVRYLVLVVLYGEVDATPSSFNLVLHAGTLGRMDVLEAQLDDKVTALEVLGGFNLNPATWEIGTYSASVGSAISDSGTNKRRRTRTIVSPYYTKITSDGTYKYELITLDANDVVTGLTAYITTPTFVPANTKFRLVVADATDSDANISAVPNATINASVKVRNNAIPNALDLGGVQWCCMGDSIAEGTMSATDGVDTTTTVDRFNGWAYAVAERNNWELTNIAIGGTGYLDEATASTEHPTPAETPAWYVARHTDFTPYNLVTLSYGINDWKANLTLGTVADDGSATTPATTLQAMKATIEAIMESNPECKLIVITPFNCAGYLFDYGDKSTNYGLGYEFSNSGTLEEFFTALVEVCNYYAVEYIDMTHRSPINRENLLDALPDGVHPSREFHELIAHELARKIAFA